MRAQNSDHIPCGRALWMVVSAMNLSSWYQPAQREWMRLPRLESAAARTLTDSSSQKHVPAQNKQVMGVVTPDTAQQELVGGTGRFCSYSHSLLLTPSSQGGKPSHASPFRVSIGAVISSRLHKNPAETILPSLQMRTLRLTEVRRLRLVQCHPAGLSLSQDGSQNP